MLFIHKKLYYDDYAEFDFLQDNGQRSIAKYYIQWEITHSRTSIDYAKGIINFCV